MTCDYDAFACPSCGAPEWRHCSEAWTCAGRAAAWLHAQTLAQSTWWFALGLFDAYDAGEDEALAARVEDGVVVFDVFVRRTGTWRGFARHAVPGGAS